MVKECVHTVSEAVAEDLFEIARGDHAIVGFEILVRVEPICERDHALVTVEMALLVADVLFESVSVVGIAGVHCVVW